MQITHISASKPIRFDCHYELRGCPDTGHDWWLVYDGVDMAPKFVGKEEYLPRTVQQRLARLRAEPKVGVRRAARHIDASMCFFPGEEHNGIPHEESVEWLRQYDRGCVRARDGQYTADKAYLVRLEFPGNEDYPLEIWESLSGDEQKDPNHLDARYHLVWKREDEE